MTLYAVAIRITKISVLDKIEADTEDEAKSKAWKRWDALTPHERAAYFDDEESNAEIVSEECT